MPPFPVGTTAAINRAPSTAEDNSATPTTPNNAVRMTPTTIANRPTHATRAISPGNTDRVSPTPSGPQTFSTGIFNMQLDGVHQYVSQCYCTIYYVYDVVEVHCYSFKCQ